MLNELHSLAQALEDVNIAVPQWHREYRPLPKVGPNTPCVRVWMDSNGKITDFGCIKKDLAARLRKYGNNQGTFPAFNVAPLYRLTDTAIISELDHLLENPEGLDLARIQSWCVNDNWTTLAGKIKLSIVGKADELEAKINTTCPGEKNTLTALLDALKKLSGNRVRALRLALEQGILAQLQSGADIRTALTLLFHKGSPDKDPKKDRGSLSVILDYAQWQDFGHPVASETVTEWINRVLLHSTPALPETDTHGKGTAVDAFGQPLEDCQDEPMPEVIMPGLAGVKLRSMFNQVHCQKRYGCFDGDSFPVSRKNRAAHKGALEYLSRPENRGKTWKILGDKEIIFAYPAGLNQEVEVLELLALIAPPREDGADQSRFEMRAKDFITSFNALLPRHTPKAIRLFSLRKMDKARTKVIFTRPLTPLEYIACAEKWQKGCANIPEYRQVRPVIPFPAQVAPLCNAAWKRNGECASTAQSDVARVQYSQGLELMLGVQDARTLAYFLRLVLQNYQGLFHFAGTARHENKVLKRPALDALSMVIPLLGLFLYKGGHEKESYMQSTGYLTGQLLKLSDELHALYCRVVRGGSIPPQLAGNSVFIIASETPVKALAMLGQRLMPYLAWARQYGLQNFPGDPEKGTEPWRARWYLRLYDHYAGELKALLQPDTRFDEFERAQVFLGYLAAFPNRRQDSVSEQNTPEEEKRA